MVAPWIVPLYPTKLDLRINQQDFEPETYLLLLQNFNMTLLQELTQEYLEQSLNTNYDLFEYLKIHWVDSNARKRVLLGETQGRFVIEFDGQSRAFFEDRFGVYYPKRNQLSAFIAKSLASCQSNADDNGYISFLQLQSDDPMLHSISRVLVDVDDSDKKEIKGSSSLEENNQNSGVVGHPGSSRQQQVDFIVVGLCVGIGLSVLLLGMLICSWRKSKITNRHDDGKPTDLLAGKTTYTEEQQSLESPPLTTTMTTKNHHTTTNTTSPRRVNDQKTSRTSTCCSSSREGEFLPSISELNRKFDQLDGVSTFYPDDERVYEMHNEIQSIISNESYNVSLGELVSVSPSSVANDIIKNQTNSKNCKSTVVEC